MACQDAPSEACPSMRSTSRQAGGVPDNPVGHGPSLDAVRATRRCHPEGSPALTASYGICLADLAWAMDGNVNLSCLPANRPDKAMFSGGFIRVRPGFRACPAYAFVASGCVTPRSMLCPLRRLSARLTQPTCTARSALASSRLGDPGVSCVEVNQSFRPINPSCRLPTGVPAARFRWYSRP